MRPSTAVALTALFVGAACDSPTHSIADPSTKEIVAVAAVVASAATSDCQASANSAIDAARTYTSDARSVRNSCDPGVYCDTSSVMASFSGLSDAQAALLFACTPASPEECDGIDNDKDGSIDEDFDVGYQCSVGVGACMRGGFKVCSSDGSGTDCTAVPGTSSAEVCDYVDNDCDGSIDEGFDLVLGTQCTAGVGACMRGGFQVCSPDGSGTECSAIPGVPEYVETCGDGIDNDCNGLVDDGCSSA